MLTFTFYCLDSIYNVDVGLRHGNCDGITCSRDKVELFPLFSVNTSSVGCVWRPGKYIAQRLGVTLGNVLSTFLFVTIINIVVQ